MSHLGYRGQGRSIALGKQGESARPCTWPCPHRTLEPPDPRCTSPRRSVGLLIPVRACGVALLPLVDHSSVRVRRSHQEAERYRATSIRLHPKELAWARREARRRKVGYQTVINEALLEKTR